MPDLPQFNPVLSEAMLTEQRLTPVARDGTTHHLNNVGGRTAARCGSPSGSRLSLNWSLVDCVACRQTAQQPIQPAQGRCPTGYRFKVGNTAYIVMGHREIAYGQVGCDVEGPNGVRCWMASEYIHEHGTAERR